MRLLVCSRTCLPRFVNEPVTHFVSLVDPDETDAIKHSPKSTQKKMQLIFSDLDDVEIMLPMFSKYAPPEPQHVEELIKFGRDLDRLPDWGLLAHCEAGISRSTAAAITILASAGYKPQVAFGLVRRICPDMLPNRRILRMADECLKTGGVLQHMAEVHRAKAFRRVGHDDPTALRLRDAMAEMSTPWGRLRSLFRRMAGVRQPDPKKAERFLKGLNGRAR